MVQISSTSTKFYKRVVPAIWFGIIGLIVATVTVFGIAQRRLDSVAFVLCVGIVLVLIGIVVLKTFVFDLVDEVWDLGDSLIIRDRGREDQIPIEKVVHVMYNGGVNPPRVTLVLREDSQEFGREIAFIPPFRLWPRSMPPVASQIINRINRNRTN